MGQFRSFTVHYDDGSTLSTTMNHKITDDQIRDYYIGRTTCEENQYTGEETYRTAVKVDIHPNSITCPHCCHAQIPHPNPNGMCNIESCGKPLDS